MNSTGNHVHQTFFSPVLIEELLIIILVLFTFYLHTH
jgi:hypothetical protein